MIAKKPSSWVDAATDTEFGEWSLGSILILLTCPLGLQKPCSTFSSLNLGPRSGFQWSISSLLSPTLMPLALQNPLGSIQEENSQDSFIENKSSNSKVSAPFILSTPPPQPSDDLTDEKDVGRGGEGIHTSSCLFLHPAISSFALSTLFYLSHLTISLAPH